MKLQKIVERLQKLHPKEIDLSLDRTRNLLEKLGNPQDQINCISVVGTNGKVFNNPSSLCNFKRSRLQLQFLFKPTYQNIKDRLVFIITNL